MNYYTATIQVNDSIELVNITVKADSLQSSLCLFGEAANGIGKLDFGTIRMVPDLTNFRILAIDIVNDMLHGLGRLISLAAERRLDRQKSSELFNELLKKQHNLVDAD